MDSDHGTRRFSARSPAQGEANIDGWSFTSDFDSGNALFTSWRREKPKACHGVATHPGSEAPSFSVEIARDCHGDPRLERARSFWFHFGVTPPDANFDGDVWLTVRRMIPMFDLFSAGYRPWVSSPLARQWQRISSDEIEAVASTSHEGTWDLSWRYRFDAEGGDGLTYFAFCIPYSYTSLLEWLRHLEEDMTQRQQSKLPELQEEITPSPRSSTTKSSASGGGNLSSVSWPLLWHDMGHRAGSNIYFRRQLIGVSLQDRNIELLTITEAIEGAGGPNWPREELPPSVAEALHQRFMSGELSDPTPPTSDGALRFPGRQVCFVSGRVHPGETPAQFAVNGFVRFILSDDPRAAILRRQYVWKVCPMLNPDGVALGHTRSNSRGLDLNRCYRCPVAEHEGVFAVKELLLSWATRGELFMYIDCHAHTARRGCFLFGNLQGSSSSSWSSKDSLLWNLAYAHVMQLNTPHMDIDHCEWSPFHNESASSPTKSANKELDEGDGEDVDGDGEDGEDVGETSRSDSGRAQIGTCCRLYHAYTLECNYHVSRTVRPIPPAPGLSREAQLSQYVQHGSEQLVHSAATTSTEQDKKTPGREEAVRRSNKPAPYNPRAWVAVGEALAVALLDLHGLNPHSRLIISRPPKPLLPSGKEMMADSSKGLERLFRALAKRHHAFQQLQNGVAPSPTRIRGEKGTAKNNGSFTASAPALPAVTDAVLDGKTSPRRRIFRVVHCPTVFVRDRPSREGKQIGTKRSGETVLVLQVRRDGWVQLDCSEVAKLLHGSVSDSKGGLFMLSPGCSSPDAFMMVRTGKNELMQDTGEDVDAPLPFLFGASGNDDGSPVSFARGRCSAPRLPAVAACVAPLIEDVENGRYPLLLPV